MKMQLIMVLLLFAAPKNLTMESNKNNKKTDDNQTSYWQRDESKFDPCSEDVFDEELSPEKCPSAGTVIELSMAELHSLVMWLNRKQSDHQYTDDQHTKTDYQSAEVLIIGQPTDVKQNKEDSRINSSSATSPKLSHSQ